MDASIRLAHRSLVATFEPSNGKPSKLPVWGAVLLISTFVIYSGLLFVISYTFGNILPTLLLIESPQEAMDIEPLTTEETEVAPRPAYITSSFRQTAKLLKSVGGVRGYFRGFAVFIVNVFLVEWITNMLMWIPFVQRGVAGVVAAVILAQLPLAWTHIVISEPSPKTWFRRLPSPKLWSKVAVPTGALAVINQLSLLVTLKLTVLSGVLRDPETTPKPSKQEIATFPFIGLGIFALGIVFDLFLILPVTVVLKRVQASLLPDTEETIVPFDRTFDGKVIPEIVGGSGMVSMLDAWKTFDWSSRIRLIKARAKVYVLTTVVVVLFAFIAFGELFLIMGKDWPSIFPGDGDKDL